MAYYFHFDLQKVEILPFGAYLSIHDFYFHPISHELCVVLAGPCSHFLMYYVIICFFKGSYQNDLLLINSLVFFFNLLPIYPMDGHRMICLLLQATIDLKNAMYLSLKISVFCFVILSVSYLQLNTLLIISYLFIQQFEFMKFISFYLRTYYSQIPSLYEREKMKVHYDLSYRRGYRNYYFINSQIYDEESVMFLLLKTVKK